MKNQAFFFFKMSDSADKNVLGSFAETPDIV